MLNLIRIFNRPLSPHLTIYSSQFTSLFSIWHRITGVSLIIFLVIFLFYFKISSYKIFNFTSFIQIIWIQNSIFINLIVLLTYHILNGIRHITWDLGYNLPINNIKNSINVLLFIIFLVVILMYYKILN